MWDNPLVTKEGMTMMHTGDIYETRARAARHRELSALANALTRILFRGKARRAPRAGDRASHIECANDREPAKTRAA